MPLTLPVIPRGKPNGTGCGSSPRSSRSLSGLSTPTTFSPRSFGSTSPSVLSTPDEYLQSHDALSSLQAKYDLLDGTSILLGSGASGAVWSARRRGDDMKVAVKTCPKPAYNPDSFTEVDILRSVQSARGVVRVLDGFSDEDNDIIVMELCHGKDLQCWNSHLTLSEIKIVVYKLLLCLSEVHDMGVTHCDIRLENVIAFQSADGSGVDVTLIDFGSSVRDVGQARVDLHAVGKMISELVSGRRISDARPSFVPDDILDDKQAVGLVGLLMSASQANCRRVSELALHHEWFS